MKQYLQWLGVIIILTVAFGTMWGLAHYGLRQSANDPQVQLAYDAASNLASGAKPEDIAAEPVPVDASLAPFLTIYDKAGKAVAGTGTIDGKLPVIPLGVLGQAELSGYHAVTWEPKDSLRLAAVAVSGKDYYVVSARSLYLIEKRLDDVLILATAGWAISVLTYLCVFAVPGRRRNP